MSNRCTATRKDSVPCRAWAVTGSDPPRCSAHGGGKRRVGAPEGNTNALKHGFYRRPCGPIKTMGDIMKHMTESLVQLAEYVDQHIDELKPDEMARLQAVRGQNLSRFARMQRDQARSVAGNGDQMQTLMDRALQKAAETLGVDLSAR